MKNIFLGSILLFAIFNNSISADEKFDNDIINYINKEKTLYNNTKFMKDDFLEKKAETRNTYLENSGYNFLTDNIEIEDSMLKNYTGQNIQMRTQKQRNGITEIVFPKSGDSLKTFNNIFSNPYYRLTLLNHLNNKIGVNSGENFITIYVKSDYVENFICTGKVKYLNEVTITKDLCDYGENSRFDFNLLYDFVFENIKNTANKNIILSYPANNQKNVQTFSLNYLNSSYNKESQNNLIGFPITLNVVNLPLKEDSDDTLYSYKVYLKEKNSKENLKTKIILRDTSLNDEIPANIFDNTNTNHFYKNYISYNDIIIIPEKMLKYNTEYEVTVFEKADDNDFKSHVKAMKEFQVANYQNLSPKNIYKFKFKTENTTNNKNAKVVYLDDFETKNFELEKNKEYYLISNNMIVNQFKCSKETKIEKINYSTIKIDTTEEDKCQSEDFILNIK